MKKERKERKSPYRFISAWGGLAIGLYTATACAKEAKDLQEIATNVTQSFGALGQMMIAIAYLAGIGFTIASIFKFKQHKDNPTQIPIGTPLAMLVIGIVLIFMPMVIKPAGQTIFGDTKSAGGFKGGGALKLPSATS